MKQKRKMIRIDEEKCNGCGLCIPGCPEGAMKVVDTPRGPKARVIKESFCDGLGACLGHCPQGALTVMEQEADGYDEEGVIAHIKDTVPEKLDQHLKHLAAHADELPQHHSHASIGGSGCPGARAMAWGEKKTACAPQAGAESVPSELRQWPVQLALVNPGAPYFKNADLLVTADCVPVAYAGYHKEFLKDKAVVIACPKLDDIEPYREKLVTLFKTAGLKSITVLNMEVPCCFGLQSLVKDALKESGKKIPYVEIVVGIKGNILP